jgi:hypothetical protein
MRLRNSFSKSGGGYPSLNPKKQIHEEISMSDEIKLLPCAHCGSPAQFAENENEGMHGMEYIECTNPQCGMATLLMQPIGEPVDVKLAEIWNARSSGDAGKACERLIEDLNQIVAICAARDQEDSGLLMDEGRISEVDKIVARMKERAPLSSAIVKALRVFDERNIETQASAHWVCHECVGLEHYEQKTVGLLGSAACEVCGGIFKQPPLARVAHSIYLQAVKRNGAGCAVGPLNDVNAVNADEGGRTAPAGGSL